MISKHADDRSMKQYKILFFVAIVSFMVLAHVHAEAFAQQHAERFSNPNAMFVGPPVKRVPIADAVSATAADPKASADARALLKYFYGLSNNQKANVILSGQQVGSVNMKAEPIAASYAKYFKALEKQTGRLPVIMGVDYGWWQFLGNYTAINAKLIEHWNSGGLLEISISPNNPFTRKGLRDPSLGGHAYDDIFTPGNEVNRRWLADLDKIAAGLTQLQDAGVVVLWRPFQEMNGQWFWWSYGEKGRATREEFLALWKHMFDYFTKEKGLHNLLWVYAPNATLGNRNYRPATYYYPGNNYVDIVGLDYYHDDMTQVNDDGSYDALVALGKPFGFAEVGPQTRKTFDNVAVVDAINTRYPQVVFAMFWKGSVEPGFLHLKRAIVENQHAKEFMNHPLILTLENKVRERQ